MLGAIIGDIIGSSYELDTTRSMDFDLFPKDARFTDDTVLTIAIADAVLNEHSYLDMVFNYGNKYPGAGYGGNFLFWLKNGDKKPYDSYGNGSAMRVSPIGFAFDTEEEILSQAKRSAEITHNHPEGIKGAQAVALAILWARQGKNKDFIKDNITKYFSYNLTRSIEYLRKVCFFDETCQGSVPQAITAFLESNDYEDAVRKAVSLGADSDTQACIAGGIAQAFYKKIPSEILKEGLARLPEEFIQIINTFNKKYKIILK